MRPKTLNLEFKLYIWLIIATTMLGASLVFEYKGKSAWSLFWLTIGGFCVFLFATQLCPYLNLWDEQYHAVVAKNCMEHPFSPMLYQQEIIPRHDYGIWTSSTIWLHKQPFFLWQIALSFKIFGVSTFSLRLPSAIMCALLIPLGYRIAKLLTQNSKTAYFTAVAIACSWYLILLTSGIESTDHNDVCFIFYVTASVWAFIEYEHRDNHKYCWSILIGLLTGAAVLTKWLPGLLVFLCWGIYLLTEKGFKIKEWHLQHFLLAFFVTAAVVLPWQVYILKQYPDMAQQELLYNFKHFNNDLEQHNESVLYFLQILPLQYIGHGFKPYKTGFQWNIRTIITYCVLAFGLFLLIRSMKKRSHRITTIASLLFVYLFFSIAKTKMPSFTFIVCIIWFMSIGSFVGWLVERIQGWIKQPVVQCIIVAIVIFGTSYHQLNYPNYRKLQWSSTTAKMTHNKEIFESWKAKTPEGCYIFNVNAANDQFTYLLNASAMFFSDRECYPELPYYEELKELQAQGIKIAVVDMPGLIQPETIADSTFIHLAPEPEGF